MGSATGPGKGHLSAGTGEQKLHLLDRKQFHCNWNCVLTETGNNSTRATEVADACISFFLLFFFLFIFLRTERYFQFSWLQEGD